MKKTACAFCFIVFAINSFAQNTESLKQIQKIAEPANTEYLQKAVLLKEIIDTDVQKAVSVKAEMQAAPLVKENSLIKPDTISEEIENNNQPEIELPQTEEETLYNDTPLGSDKGKATYYSKVTGDWGSAATWGTSCGAGTGAVPAATDNVIICNGHTVTVVAAASITNLTIENGGRLGNGVSNSATKSLTVTGNFTIAAGGTYENIGKHTASTTIFQGAEYFDPASNFIVTTWSDNAVSLVTGCGSSFGNLTLNWDPGLFYWNNTGLGYTCAINGNLTIGTTATYIDAAVGDRTITIGGNLVSSGLFRIKQAVAGNVILNVTGNTTISGGSFYGIYSENGNFTFTTTDLTVSSGTFYSTYGGTGAVTINASGTTTISGGSFYGIYANVSGANSNFSYTTNNFTISSGSFFGIYNNGLAASAGNGNISMTINGTYTQSGGDCRGNYNNVTTTTGVATYQINSVNFTGGIFMGTYACHTGGQTQSLTVNNDCSINFSNAGNIFRWVGLATLSGTWTNQIVTFTVGNPIGNLTIGGTAAGDFYSNPGSGSETNVINGNFSVSQGSNKFNTGPELTGGHTVNTIITGNVNISGGTTYFSADKGTLNATINGNLTITGGTLYLKAGEGTNATDGVATINVLGGYSQTGGTVYFHYETTLADATADAVTLTINSNNDATGNFSHTGGTLNFDYNTGSTATHVLNIYSPAITFGGAAATSMTHASAGTGTVFGEIYYGYTGTSTFDRSTTNHTVQQVKMFVKNGTTLNASGTTQNFQVASNSTQNNISGTHSKWALNILSGGIMNIGDKKIEGLSANDYYSGVSVEDGGTLQLANTAGLYDGSTNAVIQPDVYTGGGTTWRMDYKLGASSTVEYNGTSNQIVTGKYPTNIGVAATASDVVSGTTASYKYGKLKINHQGTLGTNKVQPAAPAAGTGNIFIRTLLDLTRGEFDLSTSGSVGQTVVVESGATGAITSGANGYLKSEEINSGDNRAKLQWNIGATTGAHVFPFGTVAGDYIPVTFNNSGDVGNVSISTRPTATNDNTPYAAASNVAAVTSMTGVGNAETSVIDRWWDITSSVASPLPAVTLSLTYLGAENTTSPPTDVLGYQHWTGSTWNDGKGGVGGTGTSTGTAGTDASGPHTVSASGLTQFSPYIIVRIDAPLPIELLYFTAVCLSPSGGGAGGGVSVNWATASETNNDYFTVERSLSPSGGGAGGGFNWGSIGIVPGAGNSNNVNVYKLTDNAPYTGVGYYRLKQTDFDGAFEYFQPVAVSCDDSQLLSFDISNVYTDDAGNLNITFTYPANGENCNFSLYNAMGQQIFSESKKSVQGLNRVPFNINDFAKGFYLIALTNSEKMISQKVFIQ